MKRTIYLLLFVLCWVEGMAQQVELIRIYTDKDCYLAGEELWVKVCLDDDVLPGSIMSRVAYVEIGDTAQVRAQGKVALANGVGWACVRLPQTMHSGIYQLTAYTQYMRNLKTECFPRKHIAVVNTRVASREDYWLVNDSTGMRMELPEATRKSTVLKTDKETYETREKVLLKWSSYLANAKELSLSVVRQDCDVNLPDSEIAFPEPIKGERWVTECEGHIVNGRIVGENLPKDILTQLSCVGKKMNVYEGKKVSEGVYAFFTHGIHGQQDVVLSALDSKGNAYRMELETPFAGVLPKNAHILQAHFRDSALQDRSVALQLMQAMPKQTLPKPLETIVYDHLPSKTYNLDEYVRFNTVKECIVEFVMGTAIGKDDNRTVIKMLQENSKEYTRFPVLVLIDGVAFHNHDEVLAYNARNVHYIHQYRGYYTLGETLYGGILSLITHRGTMPDMIINDDMQMLAYEFPQNRPPFVQPNYGEAEVKASRRPDFRHTMYWNPSVEGLEEVEFYTSDLEGTYVATLQGILEDGKKVEVKCEFEVK